MTLGYARPLEASDLWKLQEHRSSNVIAEAILNSFEARQKEADEYNARLANGEIKPPLKLRFVSMVRGNREERLRRWREKDGKKQASLTLAMNDSVKWWFWSGGFLKVIGDTAQITSPLILKVGWFYGLYAMLCSSFDSQTLSLTGRPSSISPPLLTSTIERVDRHPASAKESVSSSPS